MKNIHKNISIFILALFVIFLSALIYIISKSLLALLPIPFATLYLLKVPRKSSVQQSSK